ncbi:metallophosphoesterase [Cupriavidus sp. USMAA2-4]|uniref:metallophosphoesterase n=1 Tax=Cupriavidus sp. USMAA2-4 TaxID=876364 RepID=UPI0009FF9FAA|nr:metallophosphoesterase [Cupriavidus sp. USMAA2-4]
MTTPELTAAERVRIARTSVTHERKLEGCVDCEEKAPIRAIILSPSLGTPLVLPPKQTRCSLFIAAEAMAEQYFGVGKPVQPVEYYGRKIIKAKYGPVFVDRHLRLYPIQGKGTAAEPKDTMLFRDGKAASRAMEVVNVWQVGRFHGGLMVDHRGEPVAIIRPETVRLYKDMTHVYEIDIDLATLPDKPDLTLMHTFAWMVPVPSRYAQRPEVKGVQAWEYQDQVILDFLDAQAKSEQQNGQNHVPRFYEYDVDKATAFALPPLKADTVHRLTAWHPVIQKPNATLKLGHLSDVHVNVRHLALQKSPACLIETTDGTPVPGTPPTPRASHLCNSFLALRDLIEQFGKAGRADALVITGDLIDFNRNIVPAETGSTIAEQWNAFNVLNQIRNGKLYQRGADDMLLYSLLRHAYRDLKLPVFLTTGNHEAYAVPYGVSPRTNPWVATAGALEQVGALKGTHGPRAIDPAKIEDLGKVASAGAGILGGILGGPLGGLAGRELGKHGSSKAADKAAEIYQDFDRASDWAEAKANAGIAADHNLTLYEICLAYGPTYAQVLTAKNFTPANFDWFFTLITPLSDWRLDYGPRQTLLGLDWGSGENYLNPLGGIDKLPEVDDKIRWVAEHLPSRADKQGLGILPRATQSLSEEQKFLLQGGRRRKRDIGASLTVFSHFTIVNYDGAIELSKQGRQIEPQQSPNALKTMRFEDNAGGWNLNNMGTCERNVDWYFHTCVAGHDQPNHDKVDYHLSGHSHRAGVYTVGLQHGGKLVQVRSAFDPGLSATQSTNKHGGPTKLIVSSSGGPLGTQNLNGELKQWLLTAPSGTLLNEADATPIRQVRTEAGNGKPRLAVALDYLHVDKVETPLVWVPPANGPLPPTSWTMQVGPLTDALQCIDKVRFWVFMADSEEGPAGWTQIDALLKPATDWRAQPRPGSYVMAAPLQPLLVRFDSSTCRMFCEVLLKEPTWPKGAEKLKGMFDVASSWVFPVGYQHGLIARRLGEQGEVPDWDWLSLTLNPSRYPAKGKTTKVNRE